MKLTSHRYGKARVRVAKILRDKDVHTLKDISVSALLRGDFESSYLAGDNSKVVPTDTIKNTINILAKQHLGHEIERFAIALGEHFLKRHEPVHVAEIEIAERPWQRMQVDGAPHPHAFTAGGESRTFTRVVCTGDSQTIESGIRGLVILKSTGSGFEDYPKCEFTTLPETADRILATSLTAKWTWQQAPEDYQAANAQILETMLAVFAKNYSPSAQTTLCEMGEAALAVCPEISQLDMAMPNQHFLLINLSPFGLENENEVFVPTDEPHGQIEATVTRDG